MKTYRPKTGDVVIWPNGIEINYDPSNETLVVISGLKRRHPRVIIPQVGEYLLIAAEVS